MMPPPPLPAGWTEALHPTYNRTYWFHANGETSWERPTHAAAAVDPAAAAAAAAAQEAERIANQRAELNLAKAAANEKARRAAEEQARKASQASAVKPGPPGLASGWTEAVHPQYNRPYWFNADGETSWELPVDPAAQVSQSV